MLQVQGRGSLHAHIILWLHDDDVAAVAKEITCMVPGEPMPSGSTCTCSAATDGNTCHHRSQDGTLFKPNACDYLDLLLGQVLEKQHHWCRDVGKPGCCQRGSAARTSPTPCASSTALLLTPAPTATATTARATATATR